MKQKIVISALFLILLSLAASFLVFRLFLSKPQIAVINGHEFKVDLAETPKERQKGLGGRDQLCSDCGMLFIFGKKGNYNFWMKDMRFNLDIIWISGDKIVYIARNRSYHDLSLINPGTEADKVLEINAGLSDKYGFKEGDEVRIK